MKDRFWPILLKISRRDFCSRKSVVDVEIWFAYEAELSLGKIDLSPFPGPLFPKRSEFGFKLNFALPRDVRDAMEIIDPHM